MNYRLVYTIEWCKAHKYPVKVSGDTVYWQTNVATGEFDASAEKMAWHEREYFDTIEGEIK